jgi:hypothetical protein
MRALKTVLNAKPKNSKFFDYFINRYGEAATRDASEEEILKNIRSLYVDIVYGNINQDRYIDYLIAYPKVLNVAIQDSYKNVMKFYILGESMRIAQVSGSSNIITIPQFNEVLDEINQKYSNYTIIYNTLCGFVQSNYNKGYFASAAAQFANPNTRYMKTVLF